ncbi:hypothetical protein LCGC14_2184420 [marine sediment metagenome]|uniref:Uncharacterized protein n=1 Tax=marine sediment metagenome TaxID=412755 RepID=A0A0F9E8E7_9ZZZZ
MSMVKKGNIKKMNLFSIGLVSGLFTAIIAILFMIVYFLGERFGFTGVITLGAIDGFFAGESIIMFIIVLLGSIFVGSFMVLYFIKKTG